MSLNNEIFLNDKINLLTKSLNENEEIIEKLNQENILLKNEIQDQTYKNQELSNENENLKLHIIDLELQNKKEIESLKKIISLYHDKDVKNKINPNQINPSNSYSQNYEQISLKEKINTLEKQKTDLEFQLKQYINKMNNEISNNKNNNCDNCLI